MPLVDRRSNSVVLRIVYDGPPEAGKTTNLRHLCERLSLSRRGELEPPSGQERTQFFDWLDVTGGWIGGRRVRCQIVVVPGQIQLARRRRYLLDSADAIVFVADSRASAAPETGAALRSLARGLIDRADVPLLLQANKQDLPDAQIPEALHAALGLAARVPVIGAEATRGDGVVESFMLAVRLAVDHVRALLVAGELGEGDATRSAELIAVLAPDTHDTTGAIAGDAFDALDAIARAADAVVKAPRASAPAATDAVAETVAVAETDAFVGAAPDVALAAAAAGPVRAAEITDHLAVSAPATADPAGAMLASILPLLASAAEPRTEARPQIWPVPATPSPAIASRLAAFVIGLPGVAPIAAEPLALGTRDDLPSTPDDQAGFGCDPAAPYAGFADASDGSSVTQAAIASGSSITRRTVSAEEPMSTDAPVEPEPTADPAGDSPAPHTDAVAPTGRELVKLSPAQQLAALTVSRRTIVPVVVEPVAANEQVNQQVNQQMAEQVNQQMAEQVNQQMAEQLAEQADAQMDAHTFAAAAGRAAAVRVGELYARRAAQATAPVATAAASSNLVTRLASFGTAVAFTPIVRQFAAAAAAAIAHGEPTVAEPTPGELPAVELTAEELAASELIDPAPGEDEPAPAPVIGQTAAKAAAPVFTDAATELLPFVGTDNDPTWELPPVKPGPAVASSAPEPIAIAPIAQAEPASPAPESETSLAEATPIPAMTDESPAAAAAEPSRIESAASPTTAATADLAAAPIAATTAAPTAAHEATAPTEVAAVTKATAASDAATTTDLGAGCSIQFTGERSGSSTKPPHFHLPPADVPAGLMWPAGSGRASLAALQAATPVRQSARPAAWAPRGAIELACGNTWLVHSAPSLVFNEIDQGRPMLFEAVSWQAQLAELTPPGRTYALAPDGDRYRLWILTPALPTVWAAVEEAFEHGDRAVAGRLARRGLEVVDELRARGIPVADLDHIAAVEPARFMATPWTPQRDRLTAQLQRLFAAAVL